MPVTTPVASIKQIMNGIVMPNAYVVYNAIGTNSSAKGVEEIAPKITAERIRRVALGYKKLSGEEIAGIGGGFRYCELGDSLFDEAFFSHLGIHARRIEGSVIEISKKYY